HVPSMFESIGDIALGMKVFGSTSTHHEALHHYPLRTILPEVVLGMLLAVGALAVDRSQIACID
ncbi:hypothetical protein BG004_007800, partial [Podila humilis]